MALETGAGVYIGRLGVRRWPGLGPGRSCCGLVAASVRPAGLQAGVRALGPRAGRAPRGCCEEASDHANSRGRQRLLTEAAPAAFSDTLVLSSFPQLAPHARGARSPRSRRWPRRAAQTASPSRWRRQGQVSSPLTMAEGKCHPLWAPFDLSSLSQRQFSPSETVSGVPWV